jgi:hypothetical protein
MPDDHFLCAQRSVSTAPVSHQKLSHQNATNAIAQTKTPAKSTKLIDVLPLTICLQVRVLPGPPDFARFASYGSTSQQTSSRSEASEGCRAKAAGEGGLRVAKPRQTEGRSVSGVAGAERKRRRTGAGRHRLLTSYFRAVSRDRSNWPLQHSRRRSGAGDRRNRTLP